MFLWKRVSGEREQVALNGLRGGRDSPLIATLEIWVVVKIGLVFIV